MTEKKDTIILPSFTRRTDPPILLDIQKRDVTPQDVYYAPREKVYGEIIGYKLASATPLQKALPLYKIPLEIAERIYEFTRRSTKTMKSTIPGVFVRDWETRRRATFAAVAYAPLEDRQQRLNDFFGATHSYEYNAELSDKFTAVVHNFITKEVIICNRGTSLSGSDLLGTFSDLRADVAIAFSTMDEDPRFKQSLETAYRVTQHYSPRVFAIHMSGHSLGGAVNMYIYVQMPLYFKQVWNFNPGVGLDEIYNKGNMTRVLNYHIIGDPISAETVAPNTIIFERTETFSHSLQNFLN